MKTSEDTAKQIKECLGAGWDVSTHGDMYRVSVFSPIFYGEPVDGEGVDDFAKRAKADTLATVAQGVIKEILLGAREG